MADATAESDRRAALDHRQAQVAALLESCNCEQLLLLDPANIHWLCGGPIARGIVDPGEQPALFVSATHRFVVCCNVDSQRLFDIFLDNLGYQLKEWPWHQGRDQLLAELTVNKKLACDRMIEGATFVADRLKDTRLSLDAPAQAALKSLGFDLAHAVEASGRNIGRGSTEREAAGHLGHRLLHRGIEPVILHIAADGRMARDPRPGFTTAPINNQCTLFALGQRGGLHVAAARSFVFGALAETDQHELDFAQQIAAARQAAMKMGASIKEVFEAGQRIAATPDLEHVWREHPMGHFLGWLPVEQPLLPNSVVPLKPSQAQCWQVRVRSAFMADSYLQTETGPELLTPSEDWPTRRFQIGEQVVEVPDVLRR